MLCRRVGADPTGIKRTVILARENSPAEESAEAASRGSCVRIMDEASVRGRSLEGRSESGIAGSDGVAEREEIGEGIFGGGSFCVICTGW